MGYVQQGLGFDFNGSAVDKDTCSSRLKVLSLDYRFKYLRNECLFFLGSWGMNRSTGQTNCVNHEKVHGRLVFLRSDSFPMNQ